MQLAPEERFDAHAAGVYKRRQETNMMRALLSVTTLLLVVFLVMKLSATQLRSLAPAGPAASGSIGTTGPNAAGPGAPAA